MSLSERKFNCSERKKAQHDLAFFISVRLRMNRTGRENRENSGEIVGKREAQLLPLAGMAHQKIEGPWRRLREYEIFKCLN